jgi:hypothetical protein
MFTTMNPTGAFPTLGAIVLALCLAGPVAAQVAISGRILEEGTNQPIANVQMGLIDAEGQVSASALTDSIGAFRLEAGGAGDYSISIQRLGFARVRTEPLTLAANEVLQVEITLDPEAVTVDGVRVVADRRVAPWLREVRRRTEKNKRMGVGRVYLREDIQRINPHSVTELLNPVIWGARCQPAVLLDGLETEAQYIVHNGDMLEAVEIYRGATQIPMEYYRYSTCGVALVWTRPDPPHARPFTWKRAIVGGLILGIGALLMR